MSKFPWVQYTSTLLFYIVILGVIMLLGGLYSYLNPRQVPTAEELQQAQLVQQQQQTRAVYQQVLNAVGRLMVLPDAIPEISVVNDVQAFITQNPSFVGTSRGDIVLIYPTKVIIYSPQLDRIIHSQAITPAPSNLPGTNQNLQNVQNIPTTTESPETLPVETTTETSN